MFEKEAKEYVNEEYDFCYYPEDNLSTRINAERDWSKGAEFGYNKANEWHKVADGDLPKAGQKCYFIYSNFYGEDNKVIFSESSIKVLTGVYTFILDEETGDETTETCFYDDINDEEIYEQEVYAWKEITLPKEIEEPKTRRMTNKELSRWLREKPTREFKYSSSISCSVHSTYTYNEDNGEEEVSKDVVIREDDGEWREPLVEE